MNEGTIIEKYPMNNGQNESEKEGGAWKHVTLGGVSGILMGAGLLYAGQVVAATKQEETTSEEATASETEVASAAESSLPVAQMHNEMSFGEAFAAARAEVGPGGVFIWHGGIYNTYIAEEWNAMTIAQRHDFVQQVNPEVPAHEIPTPTNEHPDLPVNTTVAVDVLVVNNHDVHDDPNDPNNQTVQVNDTDSDVHIVGQGVIDGHVAVEVDLNNDDVADVTIIDINDNYTLDNDDVVMDNLGNRARLGDFMDADPDQLASIENPDVAPDMPDYMNDAMIEA